MTNDLKPVGGTMGTRAMTEGRGGRLSVSLSGTNLERASDYNQRIVLQAIRVAGEATRSDLAQTTGLTGPTIANITRRLLDGGLIEEAGRRHGARGQPAVRLRIKADGGVAIGINVDRDHVTMVAVDLAGRVRHRASHETAFALPEQVAAWLTSEAAAIRGMGLIDEERLIGIGVAIPDDLARVALPHMPPGYDRWNRIDVPKLVRDALPWRLPVDVDNDAAAAAIGEALFGSGLVHPSFFYVLVSAGLGGGLVIEGSYYRGAAARSGEIGFLPDATVAGAGTLQGTVSLSGLYARLEAAGLPADGIAALNTDDLKVADVITDWVADAARALRNPLIAINCLINPDAVLIGGRLPMPLADALIKRLAEELADAPVPALAPVLRAGMAEDAAAIGAAILPFLRTVLPSDTILMQSRK